MSFKYEDISRVIEKPVAVNTMRAICDLLVATGYWTAEVAVAMRAMAKGLDLMPALPSGGEALFDVVDIIQEHGLVLE